jgi:hypothetical protein
VQRAGRAGARRLPGSAAAFRESGRVAGRAGHADSPPPDVAFSGLPAAPASVPWLTVSTEWFDIASFMEQRRGVIVGDACLRLSEARLEHYDADGSDTTAARLDALFATVVLCCREHRLDGATAYADSLAQDRHRGGFPLREVQTAINALEEAAWRAIVADASPEVQGRALGLVSTALGTIKDRLACVYVTRLTAQPPATMRLDYLFAGTEGHAHTA